VHAPLEIDGVAAGGPVVLTRDTDAALPSAVRNAGTAPVTLTLTTFGIPETPAPARSDGLVIDRAFYTLGGIPVTDGPVKAGSRLVTVLTVRPLSRVESRLMVVDPLPAGFEIDNPNLLRAGDLSNIDWLDPVEQVEQTEFRADRFMAALDWRSDAPFQLAYIVRAVSPGSYHLPAASVEDMYRPRLGAQTGAARIEVTP